jgi:hypothetical protein
MRNTSKLMLLCAGLLIGCSSGGSSPSIAIEEQTQPFVLGLLCGDTPTTFRLTVVKPLYREGTFSLVEAPVGSFEPAADSLPAHVAEGATASLWFTFTPPPGAAPTDVHEGTIRLVFRTGGWDPVPVTLRLQALVEAPSARLLQAQVSAGDVIVGETAKFGVYFENTSVATSVTLTEVTAPDGDFSIAPDAFPVPALVGPGSRFFIRLRYAPHALGTSTSLIRVYHTASTEPLEATLTGAGAEKPSARLLQTSASAGKVVVGERVEIGLDFQNTSALTTVTVADMTLPDGEFSIAPDAPALPIDVAPGATLHLPLVYAPQGAWDAASSVLVHHSAATEPLEASLSGTGIPPRLVTYYDVALDAYNGTFESDWQYLDVPPEAVGIFLEATGESYATIDLIGLEGPSGTVYENYDMTGPLGWLSNYPAGGLGYLNVELPSSDLAAVQLESGGGTYRFRLRDSSYSTDRLQVKVTVVQRTLAVEEGTLDLRVFLADGLAIEPWYAMADAKLADMLKTIDALLAQDGIRLGGISFLAMDPYYDWLYDPSMAEEMVSSNTAGFAEGSLNLFLVGEMDYGIASIAGAVPGPTANGTPFSGVVIDFNETDGVSLGAIAAHQIYHYLGTETEEVVPLPGEAYAAMRHPLLNPGLPQDLLSPPESTDYDMILAAIGDLPPMDGWCGTCTRPPAR